MRFHDRTHPGDVGRLPANRFGRRFATAAAAEIAAADSLTARFAAVAARRGDALAVTCGDERWTYGALAARARRTAEAGPAGGEAGGDPGAPPQPHGAPMLPALFCVPRAGELYVPV
ncbi:peptide synthetase, partial [Burkholderia pseudomallei]